MIYRIVARANFHCGDFRGFREPRRDNKNLVLVHHVALVNEGLRHAKHEVWLSDLATFWEVWQSRVVGGISFRHSLVHPRSNQGFLIVGQKPLAAQGAVIVVRRPRRHIICLGDVFNERSIRGNFRIRGQRHGADFTRTMTLAAFGINDGCNVCVKGHRRLSGRNHHQRHAT